MDRICCPPLPRTERGRPLQIHSRASTLTYTNGLTAVMLTISSDESHQAKSAIFARHPVRLRVAKLDPAASYLATGDERGKVRIWGIETDNGDPLRPKYEYDVLACPINDLDWSIDGERIVVGGEGRDRPINIWMGDFNTKKLNSKSFSKMCKFPHIPSQVREKFKEMLLLAITD
ncbi:hypothetical protein ACOME3_006336 [Neoechinorhynchus agilis]